MDSKGRYINQKKKHLRIYHRQNILIKIGSEYICLLLTIELEIRLILAQNITQERKKYVCILKDSLRQTDSIVRL